MFVMAKGQIAQWAQKVSHEKRIKESAEDATANKFDINTLAQILIIKIIMLLTQTFIQGHDRWNPILKFCTFVGTTLC